MPYPLIPIEPVGESMNWPRAHTYWQVAELVTFLLRTPSYAELKRRRRESYLLQEAK